jgi:head-tail adaptor
MRKFDTVLPTNSTKYSDHIKHRFGDCTTIHTRVRIRDPTRNLQTGM